MATTPSGRNAGVLPHHPPPRRHPAPRTLGVTYAPEARIARVISDGATRKLRNVRSVGDLTQGRRPTLVHHRRPIYRADGRAVRLLASVVDLDSPTGQLVSKTSSA
ncbi:hypothetical protein [[Kitasatospora] papulosa]|uniref:hypothetical protein n=1 Tax=[Kitasatospora] papulosa TaxID=1464011 RepID=UPI003864EFB8